jgi:hypothetical protein
MRGGGLALPKIKSTNPVNLGVNQAWNDQISMRINHLHALKWLLRRLLNSENLAASDHYFIIFKISKGRANRCIGNY